MPPHTTPYTVANLIVQLPYQQRHAPADDTYLPVAFTPEDYAVPPCFRLATLCAAALLAAATWTPALLSAQGAPAASSSSYDPRVTFAQPMLPDPVNAYRSSNGAPGPAFWQNEASYEMHATLHTAEKQLSNDETITYTNNSPDGLPSLWVQLDQNIYKKDSRSRLMSGGERRRRRPGTPEPATPPVTTTDGFVFDSVEIEAGKQTTKADYVVDDTRMQIRLTEPLRAKGGQLKIHIKYHYTIPGVWGGRTSWGTSKQGDIYDMAQWYPRMAVYDDLRGWDTLPYIGSEFYLEYGHFDYYLTVPANMIVAGSGELVNPKDVLTKTEMDRLDQARKSDATVYIRKPDEIMNPASRPKQGGDLTWHFHMDHTRDVAWSASPVFVWDAARMNLPDGKTSLAVSVYPPESVGPNKWDKSTEYVKNSVENFSKHWYPYEWPTAISVAGFSTGMEYPGMVFDGIDDKDAFLFWVTAHEIGHDWFPMIVGSNETRHAFMDEGFNTFIDIEESELYAGGKYGPKRDAEYSEGGEPADTILKLLDNPTAGTLMMPADGYPGPVASRSQLLQGRVRPGAAARANPGAGALRLRLPPLHQELGLPAPVTVRLFPHNEQRRRAKTWAGSGMAGTCTTGPTTYRSTRLKAAP